MGMFTHEPNLHNSKTQNLAPIMEKGGKTCRGEGQGQKRANTVPV